MKKLVWIPLIIMLSVSMTLYGCGGGSSQTAEPNGQQNDNQSTGETGQTEPKEQQQPADQSKVKDLSGELTVWTFAESLFTPIVPLFKKKYPNVKVKVVPMDFSQMHEKTLTSLASGTGGPDIVQIEGGWMKKFNSIDGLEDLLLPPYDAGRYRDDFTEGNWQRWMSLDGKKLLGFPWDMPPGVTFYRADILEENGFPSDPAELASYMADPENVMSMAQALKAKGHYIFEWNTQPIDLLNAGVSFFDRDLNYLRNTENFAKGLDLAKRVKQLGLALNMSFWDEKGKQAVNSGKLAFVYLGAWGEGTLEDTAPSLKGKWRVTQLPFGAYGGMGGSTLSILSQSKNKELAWEFIQFMLATNEAQAEHIKIAITPGYKPAWELPIWAETKNPYFGDQQTNLLYGSLIEKIPPTVGTPLDDKAGEIWGKGINEAVDKNKDSAAALKQIQEDIEKAIAVDKQKLLEKMGKQ